MMGLDKRLLNAPILTHLCHFHLNSLTMGVGDIVELLPCEHPRVCVDVVFDYVSLPRLSGEYIIELGFQFSQLLSLGWC